MTLMRVTYKGLSDIRMMSVEDLAKRGIGMGGDLVWSPQNRKTIHIESMSEPMEILLREEGTFTVVEVSDQDRSTLKVILEGKPIDDTGSMVRDGTSGRTSVNPTGLPASGLIDPNDSEPDTDDDDE